MIYLEPRKTFDSMILGISTDNSVVYDLDAIIAYYTSQLGDRSEAIDFVYFNIVEMHVGYTSPLFVSKEDLPDELPR